MDFISLSSDGGSREAPGWRDVVLGRGRSLRVVSVTKACDGKTQGNVVEKEGIKCKIFPLPHAARSQ
jgi:hypothetical protein